MLTKGQVSALDAVRKGKNVFVTGGGGVGKSYLVTQIVDELQASGKTVLITASTGKAATLIGGVTCHRAFNIPISATWMATPKIDEDSPVCAADVVLIDEVSMLRIDAFEFIIQSIEAAEQIRSTVIQIIVVGDFGQLSPVIVHRTDGSPDEGELMSEHYGCDIGQGYAFKAPGWGRSHFVTCELTEVVRQSDRDMIDALNKIRYGDRTALTYFATHKRQQKFSDTDDVVYLCGKNRTADRINNTSVARIPGQEHKYYAICRGQVSEQDKQAPDLIRLKVGAHVIMLQNTEKYRNGSNGTITATHEGYVSVQIQETGETIDVPYATWDIERYIVTKDVNGKKKVAKEKIGTYSQLPLRLGYAVTIHKSQGQTYDKVVLCLGSDDKKKNAKSTHPEIFAYGQLYVGLSRVRSMNGLYIEGNLDLVDKLTAPEVIEFYGISGLPQKISCSTQDIESPKKTKKTTAKTSGKAAKKNPLAIEKKILSPGLSVLHCTEKNVSIAWIFAHTLSPDAVLSGTDILIPEKYCKEAEQFINALA